MRAQGLQATEKACAWKYWRAYAISHQQQAKMVLLGLACAVLASDMRTEKTNWTLTAQLCTKLNPFIKALPSRTLGPHPGGFSTDNVGSHEGTFRASSLHPLAAKVDGALNDKARSWSMHEGSIDVFPRGLSWQNRDFGPILVVNRTISTQYFEDPTPRLRLARDTVRTLRERLPSTC
ncbi:hypothetical protein NM688_g6373 [Phlebia brevispora]|uniref:Uncharacterized protein n=1 Tax=Phlebia brevispora TaxID=194682 RepID=A0ACC1SGS1_9APHY|nr:hypothetical protein NM688_g6373 [Phlebia brevispora]